MVNNYDIVSQFMPGEPKGPPANGDLFLYTELMDRTKRVGNNGVRIVKTWYHRNLEDFARHFELMKRVCDALGVRAYTRLSPRSFEKVGKLHAKLVIDAVCSENWAGMKTLYTSACGQVSPTRKLWFYDVDDLEDPSYLPLVKFLGGYDNLVATVPSKRGVHLVCNPFDVRLWSQAMQQREILPTDKISLHKDNAVNLYIPDGVA